MQDRELHGEELDTVARHVREELARRRMSRQALADAARISLSTLEKVLAGTRPFTLATTIRIEEALGTPLRPQPAVTTSSQLAPEEMGAYSHAAVRWLEGRYLTLRPSFGTPGGVYGYLIEIGWIAEKAHLGFAESGRVDIRFEQTGHVSMPNLSGHIYLVTNVAGQHRLLTLARPTIEGLLYGVLATLQVGRGSQLVPISCPVCLSRIGPGEEPVLGRVTPGDPCHDRYAKLLQAATAEEFVRFYT